MLGIFVAHMKTSILRSPLLRTWLLVLEAICGLGVLCFFIPDAKVAGVEWSFTNLRGAVTAFVAALAVIHAYLWCRPLWARIIIVPILLLAVLLAIWFIGLYIYFVA
jgi:hypothetical protein